MLRHVPGGEVWVGVPTPGTEVPDPARVLLGAVPAEGAEVHPARPYADEVLRRVHDPALLGHLQAIAADWAADEYEALVGQDRVVALCLPDRRHARRLPLHEPAAPHARAGRWCYDTMTLVGPGTREAARQPSTWR